MSDSVRIEVDLDVLKKYNRPGPRYTSYPTALHFHTGFTPEDLRQEFVSSNAGGNLADVSLYVHFPFCRTLCYFCGCNVLITHRGDKIRRYLDYLKRKIDLVSPFVNSDRRVVQMHWGGGTPNYLSPEQITEISGYLRKRFSFAPDAEVSIEIDPRTVTPEHLASIRGDGFNRVSFGVQDVNPEVQKAVNRIQTKEQNEYVMHESRRLGFHSINVDLMYGLPYQTADSYTVTLDEVVSWAPDRLAVFNYAHMPWMKKHQGVLPEAAIPNAAERLQILKLAIERLTGAGYVYIGMDHFARPGDDLAAALKAGTLHRNFQGYSTYANAEVYALGITAISQLRNVYAQNARTIPDYERLIDEGRIPTHAGFTLTDDDRLRRHVITEIMCNSRVIKASVESKFDIDFDVYFAKALAHLKPFAEDRLIELLPGRISVLETGWFVVRNIAMAFDAYLAADGKPGHPIYSPTV